jgi:hypothetical protein
MPAIRRVFALFSKQDRITTPEVAGVLGLSDRMARNLVQGWVAEGWLVVAQVSKRSRAYGLAESYRQFRRTMSAGLRPHFECGFIGLSVAFNPRKAIILD